MIQFRDGPFIRPHPSFWRIVLGINLLYVLALVFLLFQDLDSAREMMKYLDPNLGVALPEKSYGENCDFTFTNVWVSTVPSIAYFMPTSLKEAIDIFCLAHALGWFGKALILRDYWFCWVGHIFGPIAFDLLTLIDLEHCVRVGRVQLATSTRKL